MEEKYNRNVRKEDLDIEMEYVIAEMECLTTRYGKKIAIIIDFKGVMVCIFAPKRFDSKAADIENKLKKLDKGVILKVTEREKR